MKVLIALCFVAVVAQAIHVGQTNVASRIGGGGEASPAQFPYQVGLKITTNSAGSLFCGGSILNNEWVLTAAQCLDIAASLKVFVGSRIIVGNDSEEFSLSPARIIIHELWDRHTFNNDIALIQLSAKLQFTDSVQPIRLPSHSQARTTFDAKIGIVAGWGLDSNVATGNSPVLRWTQDTILSNADCNVDYANTITDSQICLSGAAGHSTCSGDFGGPLVVVDEDSQLTQVGIASFNRGFQCPSGWASVYTRITPYLDWIQTTTGSSVVTRN